MIEVSEIFVARTTWSERTVQHKRLRAFSFGELTFRAPSGVGSKIRLRREWQVDCTENPARYGRAQIVNCLKYLKNSVNGIRQSRDHQALWKSLPYETAQPVLLLRWHDTDHRPTS